MKPYIKDIKVALEVVKDATECRLILSNNVKLQPKEAHPRNYNLPIYGLQPTTGFEVAVLRNAVHRCPGEEEDSTESACAATGRPGGGLRE